MKISDIKVIAYQIDNYVISSDSEGKWGVKKSISMMSKNGVFYADYRDYPDEFHFDSAQDALDCLTKFHKVKLPKKVINENQKREHDFAKEVIRILDKKANRGCSQQSWEGFENGNGEEIGTHIDKLIRKAKKIVK